MFYFVASRFGISEVVRTSGLSLEEVTRLYEESLEKDVLCVFKVEKAYPVETRGLLKVVETS